MRKASQGYRDGQRRHLSDDALLAHIKVIHAEVCRGMRRRRRLRLAAPLMGIDLIGALFCTLSVNACSETFFGSLKVEQLHGKRFKTRREAKDETIDWLLWYDRDRLHATLACVSPMRFEQDWLANELLQANS